MKTIVFCSFLLLVLGCNKEGIPKEIDQQPSGPVVLKFMTNEIRVAKGGGTYTVKIEANTKFKPVVSSPVQGSGGKPDIYTNIKVVEQKFSTNEMTIRVGASAGTVMKDSTITITTPEGKDSATVTITQEGDPAMAPFDERLKSFSNYIMAKTAETFDLFYTVETIYTKTGNLSWANEFYNKPVKSNSAIVRDMWAKAYHTIRSINVVTNEPGIPDSLKASFTALRSIIYYQMAVLWQRIPYIDTWEIQFTPSQVPYNELLKQLATQFTQSRTFLKSGKTSDLDRISADAATLMLAKVLMQQEKHSEAKILLDQITTNRKYALVSGRDALLKKSNSELIQGVLLPEKSGFAGTTNFYEELNKSAEIFPVVTYSETILLTAECNLRLNNSAAAADLLNLIETGRGRNTKYTAANVNFDELEKLWGSELYGTFSYFDFLKRSNLSGKILNIPIYQKILPIPEMELLLNPKMLQNEGY